MVEFGEDEERSFGVPGLVCRADSTAWFPRAQLHFLLELRFPLNFMAVSRATLRFETLKTWPAIVSTSNVQRLAVQSRAGVVRFGPER